MVAGHKDLGAICKSVLINPRQRALEKDREGGSAPTVMQRIFNSSGMSQRIPKLQDHTWMLLSLLLHLSLCSG